MERAHWHRCCFGCIVGLLAIAAGFLITASPFTTGSDDDHASHTYVTWANLEPDRCASVWLIGRFVDRDARFEFVAPGTSVTNGIPLDVPGAEYARTPTRSTFEVVLQKSGVRAPGLSELAKALRQIEVAYWEIPPGSLAETIRTEIGKLVAAATSTEEAIQVTNRYFDNLYARIR